jgi:hypothetical protein
MTGTNGAGGQAAADPSGTTAQAPAGGDVTSGSSPQTTGNGPDGGALDSFFDPTSIQDKPELMAAYKQMQGSYTKRMQDFAKHRSKIDAYDAFERDPVGTMRQLATQYGLQVVQPGQESQSPQQEFQSWDDVEKHFFDKFQKKLLNPVVNEVKNLKKQSIEMQLDKDFPDWRTYEADMMDTLREHPSLVNNPAALYRLSVPPEVLEARATKAAMQKLRGAAENGSVSGASGTTKQTTQEPTGPLNFNQAVEVAKKRLAQQGLKGPAG